MNSFTLKRIGRIAGVLLFWLTTVLSFAECIADYDLDDDVDGIDIVQMSITRDFICLESLAGQFGKDKGVTLLTKKRRIDWQPGIPGGIPYYPVALDVTLSPYNAAGDGVTDDTAAIQAAIDDCPLGSAVWIPQGTYHISSPLVIGKGISVRGQGPDLTRIIQYASANAFSIKGATTAYFWGQTHPETHINVDLISGFQKGSDTVIVADSSRINVGDMVLIDQLNDPSLVSQNGVGGPCTWAGLGVDENGLPDGSRAYGELALVKAKDGQSLTLDHALYYNFKSQFFPRIVRITQNGNTLSSAGVEDLFISWDEAVNDGAGVSIFGCAHCWVRNIESYRTTYKHIDIYMVYGCEIRDSYFHEVMPVGDNPLAYFIGNRGYGMNIRDASTANLVENNIFYYLHTALTIGSGGGAGNVVGYNYMEKTSHHQPNWFVSNSGTHGAHTYMNLWEGNVLNKIDHDNYWGSGSHHVWLRNLVSAQTDCHQELSTVNVEAWNYYAAFLGNVLYTKDGAGEVEQIPLIGFSDNPVVWRIGFTDGSATLGYPGDPKVAETMIRHGNYEQPNHAVQWNHAFNGHTIPISLYKSSKPDWFGDLDWPPIGPDVSGYVHDIPAGIRFESLK